MREDLSREVGRRSFLRRAGVAVVALPALSLGMLKLAGCGSADAGSSAAKAASAHPENACKHCHLSDAPAGLSARAEMIPKGEPGEPLLMSGTIYEPDGQTTAKGALLYVYNTDAKGFYRSKDGEHEHGRLRGWVRTDEKGRYEFRTIRPAPYPGGGNPAHVHAIVADAGHSKHWVDIYWFEGDQYLTPNQLARTGTDRFGPVIKLMRDDSGLWRGARDIRLERVMS